VRWASGSWSRTWPEDEEAVAELERMGTSNTPVTVAGDEISVGFDRERLGKLAEG
jgi:hypothetical protein